MFSKKPYKLIHANVLDGMKQIPDESINCVITSPPYWNLRDYGFAEQWGLEKTFAEYLENLWSLMDEVWRVLKPNGTVFINLGDTYSGSGNGKGDFRETKGINTHYEEKYSGHSSGKVFGIPNKSLLLIPHRFAIGCIERGWILRNDIIWAKRNGMPESVRDRFSKKHEYIFFMTKQAKYYFDLDAIKDKSKRGGDIQIFGGQKGVNYTPDKTDINFRNGKEQWGRKIITPDTKNPGSVSDFWDIPTRPSSAKHYATFNTELIDKPIKSGCPENGIILDCFCGSGTTAVRAIQLNRKFIGIDGSQDYIEATEKALCEIQMPLIVI